METVLELDDNDILNLLSKIKIVKIKPDIGEETITIETIKNNRKSKMTPEEQVEKRNAYAREYYRKNRENGLEKQKI